MKPRHHTTPHATALKTHKRLILTVAIPDPLFLDAIFESLFLKSPLVAISRYLVAISRYSGKSLAFELQSRNF